MLHKPKYNLCNEDSRFTLKCIRQKNAIVNLRSEKAQKLSCTEPTLQFLSECICYKRRHMNGERFSIGNVLLDCRDTFFNSGNCAKGPN